MIEAKHVSRQISAAIIRENSIIMVNLMESVEGIPEVFIVGIAGKV